MTKKDNLDLMLPLIFDHKNLCKTSNIALYITLITQGLFDF